MCLNSEHPYKGNKAVVLLVVKQWQSIFQFGDHYFEFCCFHALFNMRSAVLMIVMENITFCICQNNLTTKCLKIKKTRKLLFWYFFLCEIMYKDNIFKTCGSPPTSQFQSMVSERPDWLETQRTQPIVGRNVFTFGKSSESEQKWQAGILSCCRLLKVSQELLREQYLPVKNNFQRVALKSTSQTQSTFPPNGRVIKPQSDTTVFYKHAYNSTSYTVCAFSWVSSERLWCAR